MSRRVGLRTIPSVGGKVPAAPITGFSDDFDDNEMNEKWWAKYARGATIDETNQEVRVSFYPNQSGGYVTKSLWKMDTAEIAEIKIDCKAPPVPGPPGPYPPRRIGILICEAKLKFDRGEPLLRSFNVHRMS